MQASHSQGSAALLGLPGEIGGMWNKGADYALEYLADKIGMSPEQVAETKAAIQLGRQNSAMRNLPTTADVRRGLEDNITGPLYEPQYRPGRYTGAVGEFVPTAIGPGGPVRNMINYAFLPGLASEAAGEATKGNAAEPWARAGAAVATGGAAALVNRPRSADQALRAAMPESLDAARSIARRRLWMRLHNVVCV